MKEQIGLSNVKYLLMSLTTSRALALCIDTHMFIVSMVIGMNEKKQICLPNKEYKSDHRSERTNMATLCKIL